MTLTPVAGRFPLLSFKGLPMGARVRGAANGTTTASTNTTSELITPAAMGWEPC